MALTGMAQLVGVQSHKPKGYGFHSWLGHILGFQARPLIRGIREPRDLFLSLSFSLPSLLSKK